MVQLQLLLLKHVANLAQVPSPHVLSSLMIEMAISIPCASMNIQSLSMSCALQLRIKDVLIPNTLANAADGTPLQMLAGLFHGAHCGTCQLIIRLVTSHWSQLYWQHNDIMTILPDIAHNFERCMRVCMQFRCITCLPSTHDEAGLSASIGIVYLQTTSCGTLSGRGNSQDTIRQPCMQSLYLKG